MAIARMVSCGRPIWDQAAASKHMNRQMSGNTRSTVLFVPLRTSAIEHTHSTGNRNLASGHLSCAAHRLCSSKEFITRSQCQREPSARVQVSRSGQLACTRVLSPPCLPCTNCPTPTVRDSLPVSSTAALPPHMR